VPSATFVTDAVPVGVYVAYEGDIVELTKLIVYGKPSGGKDKLLVRSLVVLLCVNCQVEVVTVNVATVTVIEGLVTTDPTKLSEPVSVISAAGSIAFVTDAVPDCVCVAYEGVIICGLIVYVF
jgi:hypothetical protein